MGELDDAIAERDRQRANEAAWNASGLSRSAAQIREIPSEWVAVLGDFLQRVRPDFFNTDYYWRQTAPDGTERVFHIVPPSQASKPKEKRAEIREAERRGAVRVSVLSVSDGDYEMPKGFLLLDSGEIAAGSDFPYQPSQFPLARILANILAAHTKDDARGPKRAKRWRSL